MSDKKLYSDHKGSRGGCASNRRSEIRNRRRPLNKFEMEPSGVDSVSTSAKKLKLSEDLYDIRVNDSFSYRILHFCAVFFAISNVVVCKECHANVKFTESAKRGLGFKIIITCDNGHKTSVINSPFVDKAYEINRRLIFAMRLLGIGLNGIQKYCAFMDLPRPIFHSFYDKIVCMIFTATKTVCQQSMSKAAEQEKEQSIANNETNGLTVSGDGTWRKRGFSSLYGLVTLIGWRTGKVLDILIKSKYCKACEFWGKKSDTPEYLLWKESHDSECNANHIGSAGKMEVDAVIEMFQRSEDLYNVKYANYIGDGDSKTFKRILESL